jgi:hypothetical protein
MSALSVCSPPTDLFDMSFKALNWWEWDGGWPTVNFKALNLFDDWIMALEWIADDDNHEKVIEFAGRTRGARVYQKLVDAKVDGDTLLLICGLLWAGQLVNLRKVHIDAARLSDCHAIKRSKGRPQSFFRLFQYLCDMLVSNRSDGSRFYREFCELSSIVFHDRCSTFRASFKAVESYRRTMKRLRADSRRGPNIHLTQFENPYRIELPQLADVPARSLTPASRLIPPASDQCN